MKNLRRIFFILLGGIAGFLSLIIFAIVFPVSQYPDAYYVGDEYLARKRLPNQDVLYSKGCYFPIATKAHYNNVGFHSSFDYDTENNDLAIIGDSTIELNFVPDDRLFDAQLRRLFANEGASVKVLNFGVPGAGLGDLYRLAKMAKERYNCKKIILKLGYSDILDNYKRVHGHFIYDKRDGGYETVLIPYKTASEFFRDFILVRLLFFNFDISPNTLYKKLMTSMGINLPERSPKRTVVISNRDISIFNTFISDLLALYNNPEDILVLFYGFRQNPDSVLKGILKSNGISYVDLSSLPDDAGALDLLHWHNDGHWNARGVECVSNMIMSTSFAKDIIKSSLEACEPCVRQ